MTTHTVPTETLYFDVIALIKFKNYKIREFSWEGRGIQFENGTGMPNWDENCWEQESE